MIKRLVLMALALAIVFGGFFAFNEFRAAGIKQYFANNKPPPTPVVAAQATKEMLPRYLSGIGSLIAVHQVTVSPEVGGVVTQIFFAAGAKVHAGDPLVQLNDKPERGDLANFEAQGKYAELQLKRSKELVGRQFTPQATVDQNQALLDEAMAGAAKTQAQIAQKLIRAPFDGELGIRQIDLGQYLSPGGPVVTLTDLSILFVNFTLPEQNRSALAVGQPVEVAVDAYPGRVFKAEVTTIEPQVSVDTRTIKVQATLDNSQHLLLPGMFAKASVVQAPEEALTLPETAVDYSLYGDAVFLIGAATDNEGKPVVDKDGKPMLKVTRTFVKTGTRVNDRVTILRGLSPGDRVASSGQLKLSDNMIVTLTDSDALATPAVIQSY